MLGVCGCIQGKDVGLKVCVEGLGFRAEVCDANCPRLPLRPRTRVYNSRLGAQSLL